MRFARQSLFVKGCFAFIAAILLAGCSDSSQEEALVLHIAHVNDTHSAFDPVFYVF